MTETRETGTIPASDPHAAPVAPTPSARPRSPDQTLLDLRLQDRVSESVAVDAVIGTLGGLGLASGAVDALAEVLVQALREAREREVFADDSPWVQVTLQLRARQLSVRLSDQRMPQWAEGAAPPGSDRLARQSGLAGFRRGEQGSVGNWVEYVLDLPAAADCPPFPPAEPAPALDAATAAAIQLRPLVTDDAEGLVRLIYRVYSYSYPRPEYYSPAAIRHLLVAGELDGWVASDADGTLVGHVATVPDTPYLTSELGRLLVDPDYRRWGLAARLTEHALTQARAAGSPALWAECVANHVASQRLALAAGGVEVGLLLGAFKGSIRMSGLANPTQGRQSLVPIALVLTPGAPRKAHLPEHLQPIYRRLADRLGLVREIDTRDRTSSGTLALRSATFPPLNLGFLAIDRLGSQGLERGRAELAALLEARVAVCYLDVPLADPGAAHAIALAYRQGFTWGMLFPNARTDGDVLRLQWLAEPFVDTEHVHCASEHGQAMKDWVLGERARCLPGAAP